MRYLSYGQENLFKIINYILQSFNPDIFESLRKIKCFLIHAYHNFFSLAFIDNYWSNVNIHLTNLLYIQNLMSLGILNYRNKNLNCLMPNPKPLYQIFYHDKVMVFQYTFK